MDYTIINTFNDIPVTEKTLVLCDIDETLLTTKKVELTTKEVKKKIYLPKYTDRNGFYNLLKKIEMTNSKLIFITARKITATQFTYNQFKFLNIDKDKFPIIFCGDTSKARIVKKYINLKNYSNTLFIDDLKHNLHDMKQQFDNIVKLFLFKK
jgi:hypothetical protein